MVKDTKKAAENTGFIQQYERDKFEKMRRIMLTTSNTLKQISLLSDFSGYGSIIAPSEGALSEMTLEQFSRLSCWNAQSITDGYNRLLEIVEEGQKIYYPLWDQGDADTDPSIKERYLIHFPVKKKAPFVIVCAGGGYLGCASMIEAYPTCVHLNQLGYHAFSLNYRCGENAKAPNPLDDMAYAIDYIRKNGEILGIDISDYAITGFSAGGHLAACFGTESAGWKHYNLPSPSAVFLGYPVVTMGEKSHDSSRIMFLGKENIYDEEIISRYSVELLITPDYPPTFVWQCTRDHTVPIENTQMLVNALTENNVPHKYETFDSDNHGWGAGDGTLAEGWIERAVSFWQN